MRRTGCSLLFDIIISFMLGFFVSLVSAITVLFVFCSQSKEDRVLFVSLPHGEQAVQACINHVGYFTKVFGSIFKTNVVTVNNNKFSFIVFYPVLVTLLQSCQIVNSYTFLKCSSSLFNMFHKCWYARAYINH